MHAPPSIKMLVPVIVFVASLNKNAMVFATSYGSDGPNGALKSEAPTAAFVSRAFNASGVKTSAGMTEFAHTIEA